MKTRQMPRYKSVAFLVGQQCGTPIAVTWLLRVGHSMKKSSTVLMWEGQITKREANDGSKPDSEKSPRTQHIKDESYKPKQKNRRRRPEPQRFFISVEIRSKLAPSDSHPCLTNEDSTTHTSQERQDLHLRISFEVS
jgi:hypothetical protein